MEWLYGSTVMNYYFDGQNYTMNAFDDKITATKEESVFTLKIHDVKLSDGDLPYGCRVQGQPMEQANLTVWGLY